MTFFVIGQQNAMVVNLKADFVGFPTICPAMADHLFDLCGEL